MLQPITKQQIEELQQQNNTVKLIDSSNPAGGHFAIGRTIQNLNNPPHILAHLQAHKILTQSQLAKEPKFLPNNP